MKTISEINDMIENARADGNLIPAVREIHRTLSYVADRAERDRERLLDVALEAQKLVVAQANNRTLDPLRGALNTLIGSNFFEPECPTKSDN